MLVLFTFVDLRTSVDLFLFDIQDLASLYYHYENLHPKHHDQGILCYSCYFLQNLIYIH